MQLKSVKQYFFKIRQSIWHRVTLQKQPAAYTPPVDSFVASARPPDAAVQRLPKPALLPTPTAALPNAPNKAALRRAFYELAFENQPREQQDFLKFSLASQDDVAALWLTQPTTLAEIKQRAQLTHTNLAYDAKQPWDNSVFANVLDSVAWGAYRRRLQNEGRQAQRWPNQSAYYVDYNYKNFDPPPLSAAQLARLQQSYTREMTNIVTHFCEQIMLLAKSRNPTQHPFDACTALDMLQTIRELNFPDKALLAPALNDLVRIGVKMERYYSLSRPLSSGDLVAAAARQQEAYYALNQELYASAANFAALHENGILQQANFMGELSLVFNTI